MKKLGKKIHSESGTLTAFACSCSCSCSCSTSKCTCRNNPYATHRNAVYNSGSVTSSMSSSGLMA